MKNYFYLLLFVAFNASSQYFSEDGFYQIRKLDTDNFDNFYFNEYEFNPVENAKTLLEIQKIAKDNKIPSVRYTISNESKDVTSVAVFVNNNLFSQAYYKNGLLNGKKTIFHGNGNPFHEIDFVNGKANGVYKMYNERNELGFETHFKNNLKEGKRILYIKRRGMQSIEGTYKYNILVGDLLIKEDYSVYHFPNDLKNGKVKRFSQDKLIEEYEIVSGELHGNAVIYNIGNDKMHTKVPYSFGLKNGIAEYFDANGNVLTQSEFKSGKKVGKHEKFFRDSKREEVQYYDEFGNKTGTWTKYYQNGKKEAETTYFKNGDSERTYFDSAENIKSIAKYNKSNQQNGITKNFIQGVLKSEFLYQNGNTVSAKSYYPSGAVFSIETKKDAFFEQEYFDTNGKVMHLNKISENGKPTGIHKSITLIDEVNTTVNNETYYDDNGNKIKYIYSTSGGETYESNFRNNALHGEQVNRDYNGNILKINFSYESNGKSKPVTKEEFEKLTKAEKN